MIPRIKSVKPKENYQLLIQFDDGETVIYDVLDDINTIDACPAVIELNIFK